MKRKEYIKTIQECVNNSAFYELDDITMIAIVSELEDAIRSGLTLAGIEVLPVPLTHRERMELIQ